MAEVLSLPTPVTNRQLLFRGLNYYTEAEADMFFGRDKETEHLYQLIKYNVLTLVFGKSGTGKTSLLNAGVFPLLREDDCLPFPIRLKFGDGSPGLKEQIVQVLTHKIKQDGFTITSFSSQDTLWEFFHREDLWKVITPVLIFDQFEEIFTLLAAHSPKTAELTALITELSDLIENTVPEKIKAAYLNNNKAIPFNYKRQKAKVIFAFREDFLPEMESITSFIPSVKNSRFRLLPMTARQAYEVITKTWESAIQAAEARKLVYYLTNNVEAGHEELQLRLDTMALFEIEPSLLSQVCSYLEAKRAEESLTKISAEFLNKYPKERILHSIYYNALQAGSSTQGQPDMDYQKKLQEFLEDNLINEEGYRIKFDKKKISPAILPGIDILKGHYFIREEENAVELSHDVVANIVKADRDERRKTLADAEAKANAKRRAVKILIGAGAIALVVAAAVYFFTKSTINNANEQVDAAQKHAASAQKLAANEEQRLNDIKDSINNLLKKGMPVSVPGIENRSKYIIDSLVSYNDSLGNELLYVREQLGDSLNQYRNQVQALDNTNIRYINENTNLQSELSKKTNDLHSIRQEWSYHKDLFTSFNTHLDTIIRFSEVKGKNDTVQLYDRIRSFRQNYPGFKRKLNL